MALLRKRDAKINEIYTFEFLRNHSIEEVARWASDIVNSGIITTCVVSLWDTERNYDEENESIDFPCPVNEKSLLSALKQRKVQSLIFSGQYEEMPITICFDLEKYEVNIGLKKGCLLEESEIEKQLKLYE